MNILFVAATTQEVSPFTNYLSANKDLLKNIYIDVLITGVGMVATAFEMGSINKAKYSLAINAGIAGTFNSDLQPGAVVMVKEDYLAELGAEDGDDFLRIDDLGFGKQLTLPYGDFHLPELKLKAVRGITVNTVHGNNYTIENVIKRLEPDIESMEGAAFFYSCNKLKLSSLQVRSISNKVEIRNKNNWHMALAIDELNKALINIVHVLNNQNK